MTTPSPEHEYDLGRPASLIAALPAVLGFVPERSLTVVTLDGGALGCVLRVDLAAALTGDTGQLAELAAAGGHDGAVAVIVDDDSYDVDDDSYDDGHIDNATLADDLAWSLRDRGIELHAVLAVDRICAGGRWSCVCGCGAHGVIDDPACSPVAAAAVLDGRRLYRSRSELQQVIAPADTPRADRLAVALRAAGRTGSARTAVQAAIALAQRAGAGEQIADVDIVDVVGALGDPAVRDTLYALAVGSAAPDAETLWATLSRLLPAPWRVEVLTLLAFSAYVRGDGPLAGIALEAATTIDPDHRMASMLDRALQSGMRPEQIRELALTGYRTAGALGVRLPPRTAFGRRAG